MARIQNPLIGAASGSVGGSTMSKVYGQNILRAKPLEVSNPKTAAQVAQRNKMEFAVRMSKVLAANLPDDFKRLQKDMPMSSFLNGQLVKALTPAVPPLFPSLDNTDFDIVSEQLDELQDFDVTVNAGVYSIDWAPEASTSYSNTDDKVYLFIFDAASGYLLGTNNGNTARDESPETFDLSADPPGSVVVIAIAVKEDKKAVKFKVGADLAKTAL